MIVREFFPFIYLLHLASTELISRQTSIGEEIIEDIINAGEVGAKAAESLFQTGAETLGSGIKFFLKSDQGSSDSASQSSPHRTPIKGTSAGQEPSEPSNSNVPTVNTACDPQEPNICEVAIPHIIWPERCEPQNEDLSIYLTKQIIDKPIYISHDRGCGGIDFWATELTKTQVRDVRNINGVLAVEPDEPVPLHSPYHHEKRDVLESKFDPNWHLSFISTAPRTSTSSRYFYFSKAGQDITVYHVDTGVEFSHVDFHRFQVLKRVLFATGAVNAQSDEYEHGTCLGSLICGQRLGVANRASMVVVKFYPLQSSILNALQLVIDDLLDRISSGQQVAGYTVVNASFGWINENFRKDQKLKERIKRLMNEFQAVVVGVAGDKSIDPAEDR